LIRSAKGPEWDHGARRREQRGWDEHAEFMDALVDDGFVVLGGPIGEGDGEDTLLIAEAADEDEVRSRLAGDPWAETILTIKAVEPWQVWLGELSPAA
ncbi:MAG: YciI family protein, partial [Solirubrobacterales bacterium]